MIEALADRYEIVAIDEEGLLYRVEVDDAHFPDEAVVQLASVLGEIDANWESRLAWPKGLN